MKIAFRKWLILSHRYLGIPLSFLFFMWFASGIAMIFARGMPSLTPDMRLQRLPKLDLSRVKITPPEAIEKALLNNPPQGVVLLTVMGRPAYRFNSGGYVTVFADTGDVLDTIGGPASLKIAAQFMNFAEADSHYAGEVSEPDQWTLEDRDALPMHKILIDDSDHTELYVSEQTAEVELLTTRRSRTLAWFAAIPHWMYFVPLRSHGPVWRQAVLWTSGIGSILALLGLTLALTQYRTPYAGVMRWHYISGVAFGVFSLTWVFSGLLSMEPFFWASVGGTGRRIPQSLRGGALDLKQFEKLPPERDSLKEVEFLRIQGEPYYLERWDGSEPVLISAQTSEVRNESFSIESLMELVRQGNPDVRIADSSLLSDYDAYYHASERKPPLPVLRVKFDDPDATWFYVDPHMGRVVGRFTRRERLQRWIYHGFHSLDFNFWYYQGWVWTSVMVLLNAGGVLLSAIGVIIGIRRILRLIN